MPKGICHFVVVTKVDLEHWQGESKSSVRHTDLRLELSGNLDKSVYLDGKQLPRKAASKPISMVLVMGLIANIKNSHAKGWWDESEHMRWIIDALERGFVLDANVGDATMEY